MAYTQSDLDAVKAAIASGELSVKHNGREVTYRSMDDLLKAKASIENELAASHSGRRGGFYRFTPTTSRGE